MGGSRKQKVIERMASKELNAWAILYRIAYFVPLSQLEQAYNSALAEQHGMTFIKSEIVYENRTEIGA
jgi:hypothetical protein